MNTQIQNKMDGSLIAQYMVENEKAAHVLVDDKFAFQVREWKDTGIYFVNYAGGYRKDPENDTFFGHTIASIRDGKITMKDYSPQIIKARTLMKMVAEKFGMEIVN